MTREELNNLKYSPKLYFKDVLSVYDFNLYDATNPADNYKKLAWELVTDYWYDAELGVEFTEIFISKMKRRFNVITTAYKKYLESGITMGSTEEYSKDFTNTRTPDLTTVDVSVDSGTRTDNYNMTTTTDHSEARERSSMVASTDRLYASENSTTYNYGKQNDFTKTETGTETDTHTESGSRTYMNNNAENLAYLFENQAWTIEFCLQFSNLFMGVL